MEKHKKKFIAACAFMLLLFWAWIFASSKLEFANSIAKENAAKAAPKVLGIVSVKARGETLQDSEEPEKNNKVEMDFSKITAKAFLVYDEESRNNLAQRGAGEKLPLASLTKLLTGMVAYENLNMNGSVVIGYGDKLSVEPVLDLKVGDSVLVYDLFASMLIGSANDAALALANFTSKTTGQNFVGLMNKKAESLGLTSSKFSNPIGFDSKSNFSTAEDLKKLVLETQKLSAFVSLGKKVKYNFSGSENLQYAVKATNKLVFTHPEVESIKTGYTPEASGSLISKIENSGHKIIVIVLGSENREQDTLKLAEQVFKNYKWE